MATTELRAQLVQTKRDSTPLTDAPNDIHEPFAVDAVGDLAVGNASVAAEASEFAAGACY